MMKLCVNSILHDTSVLLKHNTLLGNVGGRSLVQVRRTDSSSKCQSASVRLFSSQNLRPKTMAESRYVKLGDYDIFPWATSGLESSVIVNGPGKKDRFAFDMGYAHRETFNCSTVFISHGHMDHIAGIGSHVCIRGLRCSKPKPTYYIPSHLKDPLVKVLEGYSAMTEERILDKVNLQPVDPGSEIKINSDYTVRVFPTIHRVKSQGYILVRKYKTLKEEFKHLPGPEIGKLAKEGIQIRDEKLVPDVAYTGDSTFEIFLNPPHPDLLKVKVLITEATYIDDERDKEGRGGQQRARERGHMHLQEFVDNAQVFRDVDKIVLLHFSDKYSLGYLRDKTTEILQGTELQDKVVIGAIHKEMFCT